MNALASQIALHRTSPSKAGAELLFDVVATACERNSLIVTTHLPFETWSEVLVAGRIKVPDTVSHPLKMRT